MAGRYDISLKAGNTFSRTFRFKDGEGHPVDLTGSIMSLYITTPAGETVMSTEDNTLAMDATAGTITLDMTAADTRLLHIGRRSWYELERRVPSGNEDTLLEGYFVVEESINADA